MAITWDVKITVIIVADKTLTAVGIRTNNNDPENVDTKTYRIAKMTVVNPSQAITAISDELWAKHQAYLAEQSQIDAVIGTLETDVKANLEGRE